MKEKKKKKGVDVESKQRQRGYVERYCDVLSCYKAVILCNYTTLEVPKGYIIQGG